MSAPPNQQQCESHYDEEPLRLARAASPKDIAMRSRPMPPAFLRVGVQSRGGPCAGGGGSSVSQIFQGPNQPFLTTDRWAGANPTRGRVLDSPVSAKVQFRISSVQNRASYVPEFRLKDRRKRAEIPDRLDKSRKGTRGARVDLAAHIEDQVRRATISDIETARRPVAANAPAAGRCSWCSGRRPLPGP